MSTEEQQHVALPKLKGQPAYARPSRPAPVEVPPPRPFDPDDLPIAALQTEEERRLLETLPARAYAPGGAVLEPHADNGPGGPPQLLPRPFRLKNLAGRILKNR